MSGFHKATKSAAKLRLALIGPAGSGKTWTSLAVAAALSAGKVAVLDTERGSASKYADVFDFDVCELHEFSPAAYVAGIKQAQEAGYGVLVIDGLSQAWTGKGGVLEMHDNAVARQHTKNSFTAWRDVTPQHNALLDAIVGAGLHVIATVRAKTDYVQEKDERGKTTVRKVGLAPVQRDGLEYEFDVVGDLDLEHTLAISKTRCPALSGAVMHKPGKDLADKLRVWLGTMPAPLPAAASNGAVGTVTTAQLEQLKTLFKKTGYTKSDLERDFPGITHSSQLLTDQAARLIAQLAAAPTTAGRGKS